MPGRAEIHPQIEEALQLFERALRGLD